MKEIFYSVPKVLLKCNFIRSATSMFDILSVFITVVISLNELYKNLCNNELTWNQMLS